MWEPQLSCVAVPQSRAVKSFKASHKRVPLGVLQPHPNAIQHGIEHVGPLVRECEPVVHNMCKVVD